MKLPLVVALTTGALSLFTTTALAFQQTMTCNTGGGPFACQPGEMPKPVHWSERCVLFYVHEEGSLDVPGTLTDGHPLLDSVRDSFDTWNDVTRSDLLMQYAGLTNEDRAEFIEARGEEGNANIITWRDAEWPYASKTAFAITSVTFDPTNGLIADADIEFNSEHHLFTVGDRGVLVDARNTLTHEAGHFLGLDHSAIPEATMFGSAPEGELQKRTLHADDIQGLVSIYPSTGANVDCGRFPDYFEAPRDDDSDEGCCKGSSSVASSRPAPLLALGLVVLVGFRRRRRR